MLSAIAGQFAADLIGLRSSLPRAPFEPTTILLVAGGSSPLLAAEIVGPSALSAASVVFKAPSRVRPGSVAVCELRPREPPSSLHSANVLANSLLAHTFLDAAIVFSDGTSEPLYESADMTVDGLGIRIRIPIPLIDSRSHPILAIERVEIGGVPCTSDSVPVHVPIGSGLAAPLRVDSIGSAYVTPAISSDGVIYVPYDGNLHVIDYDGTPIRSFPLSTWKLSADCSAAAFADHEGGVLLLGEYNYGGANLLVAIDAVTFEERWHLGDGQIAGVMGLAVLPGAGVVFACQSSRNKVLALSLLDGSLLGSFDADYPINVAVDPVSHVIIVSCSSNNVTSLTWTGSKLVSNGTISGAGTNHILTTVVPAVAGKRKAHAVVACFGSNIISVYSLPEGTFVCKCQLQETHAVGLAADPYGSALVVAGSDLHVLAWPLPGMPELE
jgi:hypothetical protein